MGKFVLFSLSCIYLLIEYIFNVNLVSMMGNDTIQNYSNVDFYGRGISSVGATLIALRFIVISKITNKTKFIIGLVFSPIIFISVYFAQEKIVDIISDNTMKEAKLTQTYTHVYKKGIIHSSVNFNKIPAKSKEKEPVDHVFFASVSFWGFGFEDFINYANEKNQNGDTLDLENIFYADFNNNNDYYYSGYKAADYEVSNFYSDYSKSKRAFINKKDDIGYKVENYWDEKKSIEKKLVSNYIKIKREYNKKIKNNINRYSAKVYDKFYMLAGCSTTSCWDSLTKSISKLGISDINKYCNVSSKNGKNTVSFKSDYINKKLIKRSSYYNKFSSMGTIRCSVDVRQIEREKRRFINNDFEQSYGINNFSFGNAQSFSKSRELTNAIIRLANSKYGITLPKNWNRNDYQSFKKAAENNYIMEVETKIKNEIKNEIGFSLPLTLTKKEFLNNHNVVKYLNNNLGLYGNGVFKDNLSKDEFYQEYNDHMKKSIGIEYSNNIKDEFFIDDVFKATIVPIIGVTFSLVFGLINLSFILKEVFVFFLRIKNKSIEILILINLMVVVLVTPFFMNNHYTNHEHFMVMFNSFENVHVLIAYFYKWFLNTETVIYSLSEYFFIEIPFSKNNY